MKSGFWKRLALALTGGSAALCLFVGSARAQNPDLDDLRGRIEKLEKENQELRQNGTTIPASADTGVQLDKGQVEKIVGDYLKDQDATKKKDDDAKKKEAADKGYEVGSDLKLGATWNNGLVLQSENKDFKLHIGGWFDDNWFFYNQPGPLKAGPPVGVGNLQDGTDFRRARIQMDGSAYEVYEWNFVFDFENLNLVVFDDLWFGITQVPYLGTIRVGNVKVSQGLESYQSSRMLTFIERAAPFEAFLQEYAPGVWMTNSIFDQHVTWATTFYRLPTAFGSGFSAANITAGNNQNTGADFGNGEYAASGRVTFLPYYENDGRCLLHLGGSYTFRETKFDVGSARDVFEFRTRSEIRDNNNLLGDSTRFIDTGLFQADNVQIVGAELAGSYGPINVRSEWFGAFAEHAFTLPVAGQKPLGDLFFQGWYAQASYFLTGENYGYDRRLGKFDRVKPFTNFWWVRTDDGCCRGIGAWEIALRYSLVDFNDSPVEPPGIGSQASGGQLQEYTVGLNWYLNPNTKIQFNYVRANRDVNNPNHSGNVDEFGMNFHFDF